MVDERGDAGHAATMVGEGATTVPKPGVVFAGRYVIERALGRGGMGAVWAAVDRQLGEPVALKILDGTVAGDAASVERFRREVRLARRVTHRNVARIFDIGEHQGTFYLTMELVVGKSLADVLAARTRLEVGEAIDIAKQIAEGLSAAHAVGVVHRDLKPGNVLIGASKSSTEATRVAVTDFGIAVGLVDDVRLTRDHNALLGTPAYMAPEQVRGGTVDARTDIYALGLVLYEMLTGALPFDGDTALQLAVARLDRDPPDLRSDARVPAALAELVMQCLQRESEGRPASAEAIALALAEIDAPSTGRSTSMQTRVPTTTAVAPTTLAPMASAATLAVLPLRYRGPADEAYLAETLTDELVDLLSATRGLKVMASGATSKYAGDRDPFTVGRELGVDIVVDGTVQRGGSNIRISARLVDVASGFQTWNGRFDGELADVFELQDLIAKKIAETLRVELETDRHRGDAPPEAIELYMRARALTRQSSKRFVDVMAILPLYEQCLALAPGFAPALAGHASIALRAWFRPEERERHGERETVARAAVAAAVAGASQLAETHLALARLAVQDGRFRDAANALSEALRIAPTYPEAHEYAGSLMCEAGQPERGMKHLALAVELDPAAGLGLLVAARHSALQGDRAQAEAFLARLRASDVSPVNGLRVTALRIAAWFDDDARMRELFADPTTRVDGGPMFDTMLAAYFGETSPAEVLALTEQGLARANPRFRTMVLQFATEASCRNDAPDIGWQALERAADDVLVDLHWLDRCPLLAPLRARPEFKALREKVKQRAEAIWQVG
ncbi:MAG TPA: protein kinase [Nannocystaceae bacterium]|nr:protein kinase [Nannocystaceae bacterium]